jgi:hypothetical protein
MKPTPKILFLLSIIFLLLVFAILDKPVSNDLQNYMKSKGFTLKASDYEITERSEKIIAGLKITEVSSANNDKIIKVKITENMEEKIAELYEDDKKSLIDSLFVTQPAPYPGVVTRIIDCPEEFKPEEGTIKTSDMKIDYYIMYSNDRFFYGVCSPDLIKYRSVVGLAYCKTKNTFVEIELFTIAEKFDKEYSINLLNSFSCG